MAEKTKRYWKHTQSVISDEGEVLRTQVDFTSMQESESAFYKTFANGSEKIYQIKQARTVFILLEMLRKMDYDNIIEITYASKLEICVKLGILKKDGLPAPGTFDKHPKKLIDVGILFKVGVGKYFVNPHSFGKGQWLRIKKFREFVKVGDDGREYLDGNVIN